MELWDSSCSQSTRYVFKIKLRVTTIPFMKSSWECNLTVAFEAIPKWLHVSRPRSEIRFRWPERDQAEVAIPASAPNYTPSNHRSSQEVLHSTFLSTPSCYAADIWCCGETSLCIENYNTKLVWKRKSQVFMLYCKAKWRTLNLYSQLSTSK